MLTKKVQMWLPQRMTDGVTLCVSILGLCIVGYLLFMPPPIYLRNAKVVGTIETSGTVKRRHTRSPGWNDIQGKAPVYLRDVIYAPKDTNATISFTDKRTLRLEPDSMVQLDELVFDQLSITLINGNVSGDAVVTPAKSINFVLHPKVRQTQRLVDPLTLQGRLDVVSQKLTVALSKGASLIPVLPVSTPQSVEFNELRDYSLLPIHPLSERYRIQSGQGFEMRWSKIPLPNIQYQVEFSKDSTFTKAITHRTSQDYFSAQFVEDAVYYWRVKAYRGQESVLSPTWKFTISSKDEIAQSAVTPRPLQGGKEKVTAVEIP